LRAEAKDQTATIRREPEEVEKSAEGAQESNDVQHQLRCLK
jgi:hypothetical protein